MISLRPHGWSLLGAFVLIATILSRAEAATASLPQLAETRFTPLSPVELALVEHVADGKPFVMAQEAATPIRGELLQWLCADPEAQALLPHQGVSVAQARFTGAIDWKYLKLTVPIALQNCELDALDFDNAELLTLDLSGSRVVSLRGEQMRVQRDFTATDGFTCTGVFHLPFAWIEGHLDLSGARLWNTASHALFADGCRIDGDLRLRAGAESKQQISLAGVRIAGNLDCDQSQLGHAEDIALSLPGARINGNWTFREAKITGGVICHGTQVLGDVDGDQSQITFPDGTAFRGYALDVGGDLRFIGAHIAGNVLLESATVGRDLNFADTKFDSSDPPAAVTLQGLTAGRRFRWTGVKFRPEAPVDLDLRSATVGILYDDETSWPPEGHLRLQGFDYSEIHDDAPFDAESRIRWLRRQHKERFRTQPYEHVAELFRKGGQAAAARQVLIAKEADRAEHMQLTTGDWYWYRVFGPLIGYGYEPWRSFPWILGVVMMGATFFQIGYWCGWMTPTKVVEFVSSAEGAKPHLSPEYPKFNAIVYSLDVFAPLTYLHQANYWVPNPARGTRIPLLFWWPRAGELLRLYLWLHVAAGWTLTFLLVAGLSGLVQH